MPLAPIVVLAAASGLLVACDAYTPAPFPTQPGDMGNGPGLFTGKQGAFVILGPAGSDPEQANPDEAVTDALPPAKPPAGYKPLD